MSVFPEQFSHLVFLLCSLLLLHALLLAAERLVLRIVYCPSLRAAVLIARVACTVLHYILFYYLTNREHHSMRGYRRLSPNKKISFDSLRVAFERCHTTFWKAPFISRANS